MPFAALQHELDERAAQGLLRSRRTMDTPQSPHIIVDDKPYLAFCSNDYLGLANHPQLIVALQQGAQQWGLGAGAAHLVSGHFAPHHQIEQRLAAFAGKPAALLFSCPEKRSLTARSGSPGATPRSSRSWISRWFSSSSSHSAISLAVRGPISGTFRRSS